jgi:O-antigen/teichoic acid export membrane protein
MLSDQAAMLTTDSQKPAWYHALLSRFVRNQWMVADQALVSGMNFSTTALLARALGVHNFGIFSVLYIGLQYLNSIQAAVIFSPMMSLAPQLADAATQRTFLRGMAGYQYILSLGCCVAAAVCALPGVLHLERWHTDVGVLFPFLLCIFCFQVQDWYRRRCYVQERSKTAFFNDVISYLGQVAVAGLLWWAHWLTVATAFYVMAGTSIAAFGVGWVTDDLRTSKGQIRDALARSWRPGKSLLVASQLQWLGSQGIVLLIAAIVGVSAASGIRAVVALMGPVYVLYQLLDNIIPVRAAREYAANGHKGLFAYLRNIGTFLALLVAGPVILVCIFARPIMTVIFGHSYAGFAVLVMWQGIYTLLALLYRGMLYYYRTLNTTVIIARSAMLAALISLAACLVLGRRFGATGGMVALVAGQIVNVSIPLIFAIRTYRRPLETLS